MLRGDITEQLHRKTRVVFDDPVDFLNRLSPRPEFDRAELQPFHENIAGARGDPADIDPVNIDGKEANQNGALWSGIDWGSAEKPFHDFMLFLDLMGDRMR